MASLTTSASIPPVRNKISNGASRALFNWTKTYFANTAPMPYSNMSGIKRKTMATPLLSGVITAERMREVKRAPLQCSHHHSCGMTESLVSSIIMTGKRNMTPTLTVSRKTEETNESREKYGVTSIGAANEKIP